MSRVKYLVMDVDGTLTDGKIYMGQDEECLKAFSVKDGCGIHLILPQLGITPIIITARESRIVEKRCNELKISELYQSSRDKLETLMGILNKYDSDLGSVAYIGDDLPDVPCMEAVKNANGIVMCPADAISEIKEVADYVSIYRAGDGAVRDCIEYLSNCHKNTMRNLKKIENVISIILAGEYEDKTKGILADGTPYTIQEYVTKDENECVIESHRNHIDVQYIIEGQEKFTLFHRYNTFKSDAYDGCTDTDIWTNGKMISELIMTKGSIVVVNNNQLHRGAAMIGKNNRVRKIVCKINVND